MPPVPPRLLLEFLSPLAQSGRPRLQQQFFTCRSCLAAAGSGQSRRITPAGNRLVNTVRARCSMLTWRTVAPVPRTSTRRFWGRSESSTSPSTTSTPLASFSRALEDQQRIAPKIPEKASAAVDGSETTPRAAKKPFFPENSDEIVGKWLLWSAASVFGIVVFGGLTRLTESGLSITEWKPVTGSLPPMSAEAWESEFALYRASPEFQKLNPHMTLPEFKEIYWMEWGHRLWGRVIGLTFALPTAYFIARRRVSAVTARRLVGICGLIGLQGGIGWWMVKSGLRDDLFADGSHPRVSQYRLTAHLAAAITCYAAMLLSGLSVLRTRNWLHKQEQDPKAIMNHMKALIGRPRVRRFRHATTAVTVIIFLTAMSGGLVAGLDAGLIYNEFPTMGIGLTPPRAELFDPRYCRRADQGDLVWRNMLENPSLVQLDHRILALTTFTAVNGLALWAYSSRRLSNRLPAHVWRPLLATTQLAWVQVGLGLATLLYLVPTPVAATHQAGALALLTGALVLGSKLRVSGVALRLLKRQISIAKTKTAAGTTKTTAGTTKTAAEATKTVAGAAKPLSERKGAAASRPAAPGPLKESKTSRARAQEHDRPKSRRPRPISTETRGPSLSNKRPDCMKPDYMKVFRPTINSSAR